MSSYVTKVWQASKPQEMGVTKVSNKLVHENGLVQEPTELPIIPKVPELGELVIHTGPANGQRRLSQPNKEKTETMLRPMLPVMFELEVPATNTGSKIAYAYICKGSC